LNNIALREANEANLASIESPLYIPPTTTTKTTTTTTTKTTPTSTSTTSFVNPAHEDF
jgi:hypothetical protein